MRVEGPVIGTCACGCGSPLREVRYLRPDGSLNRLARPRFRPGHNLDASTALTRSDKLVPAAPLWRLIEARKVQAQMTWRELACALGVGEGGQDAQLLRLRRQRFVYRWNAERLLRALAGMPRAASATEAALSERMQDRDRRARQARDQARRRAEREAG